MNSTNSPASDPAVFERLAERAGQLRSEIERVVIGQRDVIDPLIVSLFCQGHTLIVGVPGLAKTLLVRTLARGLGLDFRRIQFTPDMMPTDILGTELIQDDRFGSFEDSGRSEPSQTGQEPQVPNPAHSGDLPGDAPASTSTTVGTSGGGGGGTSGGGRSIRFVRGPIFAQLILADEINRTPPRTQAALLEAMAERQVTVGGRTMTLTPPFVVVATQNPIEQEGTYPLPEAQLDRFMFSLWMDYPALDDELRIAGETRRIQTEKIDRICQADELLEFSAAVWQMPVSEHVVRFAVDIARRTRPNSSEAAPEAKRYLEWGAGPRAGQYLLHAARAVAAIDGRPAPSCQDVRKIAPAVLRHRIILNYAATGEGITTEKLIESIINSTPEPLYD